MNLRGHNHEQLSDSPQPQPEQLSFRQSTYEPVNNEMSSQLSTVQSHIRLLRILSPTTRLFTIALIHLLSILPLFDSSPSVSSSIPSKPSPLLRWDAFHFANIAQNGYVHEYEWAFFPGTPLVMRIAGEALRFLKGSSEPVCWDDLLQGGAIVAFVCDVGSTTALYHLTLHHLGSTHIALITSVLSLLPSSPATLHFAAYSEPFFTYLSYKGVLRLLISTLAIYSRFVWYVLRHVSLCPLTVVGRVHILRSSSDVQIQRDPT